MCLHEYCVFLKVHFLRSHHEAATPGDLEFLAQWCRGVGGELAFAVRSLAGGAVSSFRDRLFHL